MADSMEMMILSILPLALHCQWGINQYQQAFLTTIVFIGQRALPTPIQSELKISDPKALSRVQMQNGCQCPPESRLLRPNGWNHKLRI
jgi:hypothetical protein